MMITNLMQLLVPLFGLLVLYFLREALLDQSAAFINEVISLPIPFFYNIPLKPFRSFSSLTFFNVSECDEWYLYKFNESSTDASDRAYFGANDGVPMYDPESEGMLTAGINVLGIPCGEVNRTVPYFVELTEPEDR
jgi:hypothetical protein